MGQRCFALLALLIPLGACASESQALKAPMSLRCENHRYIVTFEPNQALIRNEEGENLVLPRLPGQGGLHGPLTYTDGHLTFTREPQDPDSAIGFARDRSFSGICEVVA